MPSYMGTPHSKRKFGSHAVVVRHIWPSDKLSLAFQGEQADPTPKATWCELCRCTAKEYRTEGTPCDKGYGGIHLWPAGSTVGVLSPKGRELLIQLMLGRE